MPDPLAFARALAAAAAVSAAVLVACRFLLSRSASTAIPALTIPAVLAGLVVGYRMLQFPWIWPPTNALNRFLMIVLPTVLSVEWLAGITTSAGLRHHSDSDSGRKWVFAGKQIGWLRLGLCLLAGRILLHDSVYLRRGNPEAWTSLQSWIQWSGFAVLLLVLWSRLRHLALRRAPGSVGASLALAILCGGMTTMMTGYLRGGTAALPLAATVAATSLALTLWYEPDWLPQSSLHAGIIGIGAVGLFSLLCIGRYFGQLTSLQAVVIFLSPLMCWITEHPRLSVLTGWKLWTVRLLLVAIPLGAVLFDAKREFDERMAPLVAVVEYSSRSA